jgi:hypothetical protein
VSERLMDESRHSISFEMKPKKCNDDVENDGPIEVDPNHGKVTALDVVTSITFGRF